MKGSYVTVWREQDKESDEDVKRQRAGMMQRVRLLSG
jgi:hypothetical protein